ncbi:MAG TPA: TlpA disulfide reductase family protein [Myxococcota bacterium]|nr:TlpA disulfide reductase family protein [Myxococcota bacterium]HTO55753.1 TlpA disulfide reductase family protein [Myxococcota bacterium]
MSSFRTLLCAASCGFALAAAGPARAADVGAPAPDCALTPLSGQGMQQLRALRGEVVWVDFWATWCGRCIESFSFLDALQRELGDDGLRVVAVNVNEHAADARDFLAKHPVSFSPLFDPGGRCAREFAVQGMPSSYLVDRHGVIRAVYLGFRSGEGPELRARARELLAESSR